MTNSSLASINITIDSTITFLSTAQVNEGVALISGVKASIVIVGRESPLDSCVGSESTVRGSLKVNVSSNSHGNITRDDSVPSAIIDSRIAGIGTPHFDNPTSIVSGSILTESKEYFTSIVSCDGMGDQWVPANTLLCLSGCRAGYGVGLIPVLGDGSDIVKVLPSTISTIGILGVDTC